MEDGISNVLFRKGQLQRAQSLPCIVRCVSGKSSLELESGRKERVRMRKSGRDKERES